MWERGGLGSKMMRGGINAYVNHQKNFLTDVGTALSGSLKKSADKRVNKFVNSEEGQVVKALAKLVDKKSGGKLTAGKKKRKKNAQKRAKAIQGIRQFKFQI